MLSSDLPLRLYLASVPGDMDGERAIVEGMVLPELRALAAKVGIEIEIVDPSKDAGAPWDLARRFREIEACQPFFIALVGERYGEPPSAVPLELIAAQPWLMEDPGRSVLELEILHGALRTPSAENGGFFYFRSPHFPSLVSAQVRAQFLPEGSEAAERLSRLKDRIRDSGRPIFDGYPCGWSDGLERASGLDALAEQMLENLWRAIQESADAGRVVKDLRNNPITQSATNSDTPSGDMPPGMPPRPPHHGSVKSGSPAHLPPEKALPVHEDVQFTVYRPRAVEPLKWYPLLAFAHLSELPEDAAPDEPDPVEEVKAQAQRVLGDLAKGYADVKQDSRYAVPHEAEITFLPEIPGFEVNPPRRTFLWLESVQREEFRIRAGAELDGTLVRGRMTVFWGNILLAEISLGIRVDSRLAGASIQPPPERAAIRPFRNIFPSYSHRDTRIVEEFERYARTLGDRYLRDVHELRAGEAWNDRLKDLIRQADVFQLFWSRNAMQSPYVEEEWRYALSLGRSRFVRPTYWEDPLPELPERGLPPEDLRRLHFQLLSTGTAVRATAHGPAEPPSPVAASRSFDLNATILAFPSAPNPPEPDLDETRAAPAPTASALPLDDTAVNAPPPLPSLLPAVAADRPPASRRLLPALAMIVLALICLPTFIFHRKTNAIRSRTTSPMGKASQPPEVSYRRPPLESPSLNGKSASRIEATPIPSKPQARAEKEAAESKKKSAAGKPAPLAPTSKSYYEVREGNPISIPGSGVEVGAQFFEREGYPFARFWVAPQGQGRLEKPPVMGPGRIEFQAQNGSYYLDVLSLDFTGKRATVRLRFVP